MNKKELYVDFHNASNTYLIRIKETDGIGKGVALYGEYTTEKEAQDFINSLNSNILHNIVNKKG